MYLALVAEMQVRAGEAGVGYSLMLEAARKSDDPELFRRAVNIALQSRSGSAAVDAADAWASELPTSAEPHRVLVQMLISMDRIEDSAISLEKMLDLTPANERSELLDLVGQVYARAKDTALAATVLAAKLRPWLTDTSSASSAYAAMARVQAAAGMVESARTSLADALKQIPSTPAAGVLAADWLDQTPPTDELTLRQYIERNPDLRLVRMAYARFLLRANRWQDSEAQLKALTASPQADIPEAWVILGALQLQLDRPAEAETSFKTFLSRISSAQAEAGSEAHSRGKTQAYLSLAHIAERAKRLDEARAWLDQVDTAEDALRIQTLRAALLAREGKLPEARTLIQSTPESQPGDALAKLKAEAQLLKEAGQTAEAYAVLNQASMQAPEDFDLVYERAMLAEKLGKTAEMERLLRSIIQAQPDNHNALNALGYSLADRNERLPEAKALIDKALSLAPDDAFITDSLGWVLFRMGQVKEAAALLKKAFGIRQDVEIAVHLGEVLWTLGNKDAAIGYFKQAQTLQPGNELLKSTLLRLNIKL
jgi:tetratricopeptide (TPR) repeat protein